MLSLSKWVLQNSSSPHFVMLGVEDGGGNRPFLVQMTMEYTNYRTHKKQIKPNKAYFLFTVITCRHFQIVSVINTPLIWDWLLPQPTSSPLMIPTCHVCWCFSHVADFITSCASHSAKSVSYHRSSLPCCIIPACSTIKKNWPFWLEWTMVTFLGISLQLLSSLSLCPHPVCLSVHILCTSSLYKKHGFIQ